MAKKSSGDNKNNVTPIFKGMPIAELEKSEVVPQVVEQLEWLLQMAKEGKLTFIGYVGFGGETYYQEIIGKFDTGYGHLIGNAFRSMDMEFFDNFSYPDVMMANLDEEDYP